MCSGAPRARDLPGKAGLRDGDADQAHRADCGDRSQGWDAPSRQSRREVGTAAQAATVRRAAPDSRFPTKSSGRFRPIRAHRGSDRPPRRTVGTGAVLGGRSRVLRVPPDGAMK